MNERIRELREQAAKFAEVTYDNYTMATFNTNKSIETLFEEKFAQLIVRECAQIAVFKDSGTVATADVAGHMAAGRSIAARLIKEHFGVEE